MIRAGPVPHFKNGWQSAYQFRPTISLDLPIAAFNAEPWRDLGCTAEYLREQIGDPKGHDLKTIASFRTGQRYLAAGNGFSACSPTGSRQI